MTDRQREGARSRTQVLLASLVVAVLMVAVLSVPSLATAEGGAYRYRAPIGVTEDRALVKGEWGASYRFEQVRLEGSRSGTDRLSVDEVLRDGWAIAPRDSTLDVHWIGVTWAPYSRLTVSVRLPILEIESSQVGPGRPRKTTRSQGVGDLRLTALIPFMRRARADGKGEERLLLSLGLGVPFGSTTQDLAIGSTGTELRLPYPMQLGSGTWDLASGFAYTGELGGLGWGINAKATFRTGRNSERYRLGHHYEATGWIGWRFFDWFGLTARVAWDRSQELHGRDYALQPAFTSRATPEVDPKAQGSTVLAVGPGVEILFPWLRGHRLGIEVVWPVYQSLSGPQLEQDRRVMAGWEWVF